MAKPIDVIRFEVSKLSKRIRDLKESCLKVEKDRYGFEKVVDHVNPSHKRWNEYRGLKKEVTIWLCALKIEKAYGKVPSRVDLTIAMTPSNSQPERDFLKSHGDIDDVHAGRVRLERLYQKMAKHPDSFNHVDAWLQIRAMSHA